MEILALFEQMVFFAMGIACMYVYLKKNLDIKKKDE